jgi:hypothetical protein
MISDRSACLLITPAPRAAICTCCRSCHLHNLLNTCQSHLHKYVLLNDQIKMFEASKISSNANIKVCYFRPLV